MTLTNDNPRVFLSYSRADLEWARSLAEALQRRGVRIWFDQWDILPGDRIDDQIEQALQESEFVVVLIGLNGGTSSWAAFELGAALGMGKKIVPVVSPAVPIESLAGPIRSRRFVRNLDTEEIAEQLTNDIFNPGRSQDNGANRGVGV